MSSGESWGKVMFCQLGRGGGRLCFVKWGEVEEDYVVSSVRWGEEEGDYVVPSVKKL